MDITEQLTHESRIALAAVAEIIRLRARLEVRDDGGPDGILCRDESIRMQDAEIARLRAEVEALRGITPELPPRPPDGEGLPRYGLRHNGQSMPMSVPMADGYWTPYHLAIAEVEALRADAERWRYINERNGEWRRFEADGPDPAYSMLCVRLPYDADLSCRATREIAIDAARAAQGEKS